VRVDVRKDVVLLCILRLWMLEQQEIRNLLRYAVEIHEANVGHYEVIELLAQHFALI
jgi:hypothetical protein